MAGNRKQLLIVDDTEIDRMMLRSFLVGDFDVMEVDSGNLAFEYISTKSDQLDCILLDISMPNINGFDVLKFMADKGVTQIPVFMITAEPTRENVERALQYNIAGFIGKPFDREDVLRRLRSYLGVIPDYDLRNEELKATLAYVSDLKALYKQYLANFGKDAQRYQVMSDLMKILLNSYSKNNKDIKLNKNSIDLISKAAYFCDIGEMFIPDKRLQMLPGFPQGQDMQRFHTMLGANFIRLNRADSCEYFVEICSSMCMYHHERYDGQGYPDGLVGESNSVFNQMCHLVDEFESMRAKFFGDKARPIKLVLKRLANDAKGMVGPKVYALLEDCESQISDYFMKKGT